MAHEAMLYEKLDDRRVKCNLCAHRCVIAEGRRGVCQVRKNRDGTLITLVFGNTISQHVDPIEKKPLYHFLPGTKAFSIATPGCNFHCQWCQNWDIVKMNVSEDQEFGRRIDPGELVQKALESGSASIAYTYTEPTIFFEYAYQTARQARDHVLKNIFVTNGYMTPEMLETMDPYLDAANVDLKAFNEKVYHRHVGAGLEPILENLKIMKDLGIWVEVTTLVIPGVNDDDEELRQAADFISGELGPETPWHLSRFYPQHQMQHLPPTPLDTLYRAREIGQEAGLRYIYLGNTGEETNTRCHACDQLLIRRSRYIVGVNLIEDGRCPNCGTEAAGVWD